MGPGLAAAASASAGPQTEGARLNRLRRLCERKPSGRLLVPESIHLKWKNGGSDREALMDELERAGWSKDRFKQKWLNNDTNNNINKYVCYFLDL